MCVIIYIPKTATIKEEELKNAWTTNPDGAGYSIQKNGKVFFKRGFMKYEQYKNEVMELIGKYNIILHFRISTSKSVNKVQTHPYKKGNVTITEGATKRPVICMNGVISNQKEYQGCNDTMSYIVDHEEAFANINQDILNIIEEATGAKWAVMTPDKVLLSSKFTEENGRFYSNTNHLWRTFIKKSYNTISRRTFNNMIKGKELKKAIRKDKLLHEDICDFIDIWCNGNLCGVCTKCLKNAKSLRDVKITLNENFYYEPEYEIEEETCCLTDYFANDYKDFYYDFYDYNSNIFDE